MKRMLWIGLFVLAGCKQGEGERCQVDDDCARPLVCNKAKNTCQSSSGGDLDAPLPDGNIDAPMADASMAD